MTFYGENNPIDGIVLRVLLRKHEEIRKKLGISVPVPMETESVQEAIFESLLLREDAGVDTEQLRLDFLEEHRKEVDVVLGEEVAALLFAGRTLEATSAIRCGRIKMLEFVKEQSLERQAWPAPTRSGNPRRRAVPRGAEATRGLVRRA